MESECHALLLSALYAHRKDDCCQSIHDFEVFIRLNDDDKNALKYIRQDECFKLRVM